MKNYEISHELLEAILKYLHGRPYNEVYQGIQGLQGLKEIKKEDSKEEKASA